MKSQGYKVWFILMRDRSQNSSVGQPSAPRNASVLRAKFSSSCRLAVSRLFCLFVLSRIGRSAPGLCSLEGLQAGRVGRVSVARRNAFFVSFALEPIMTAVVAQIHLQVLVDGPRQIPMRRLVHTFAVTVSH